MLSTYDAESNTIDGIPLSVIAEKNREKAKPEQREEEEIHSVSEDEVHTEDALWVIFKFLFKAVAVSLGIAIFFFLLITNIWAVVGFLLVILLIILIIRMLV